MTQVNNVRNVSQFCKILNEGSTSVNGNCILIDMSDTITVGGNDDVIQLKDDDCVFVKKEKNLLSGGKNRKTPICVDDYVNDIRVTRLEKKPTFGVDKVVHCVDSYDVDDDDEVKVISMMPCRRKKRRNVLRGISVVEIGESSGTKNNVTNDDIVIEIHDSNVEEMTFLCEICVDSKPKKESFTIKGCSHRYCSECIQNYVASKLQDGVSRVNCPVPNCNGVLEPEYCREILPFDVFERWGNLLTESVILASQKFYCPFKDCSALLIDDGGVTVTQAECPSCFRMFCAQCKVGWHDGIACSEFQKLNENERQKEDIMLRNLAKTKQWQRCPACKYYVERSEGCLYMKCRCGIAFCYRCGAINTDHAHHYCKKCGR